MPFDTATLIVAFVLSSIGFVGFIYGRRQSRLPHMVAGALLMGLPFFVQDPVFMGGGGLGIILLWWLSVRLGA